jgi:hypothetical protein
LSLRAFVVAIAILLSLLAAAGCGGAERAAKAEAAGVVRAVAALRDAPNEAKAPLLATLKGAACSDPEVCALKKVCVSAYEQHLSALELTAEVKGRLDSGADAGEAQKLGVLLGDAERKLVESRTLSDRCVEREGAARRRFKL